MGAEGRVLAVERKRKKKIEVELQCCSHLQKQPGLPRLIWAKLPRTFIFVSSRTMMTLSV